MKVKQLMTRDVTTTAPTASLTTAARSMWDRDCGILPVVDTSGHVSGVITDRDICKAVTTSSRPASRISVSEIVSHHLYSASPEEDVAVALENMKTHQVRRLPVIDASGHLEGIVSMNDIVLNAGGPGGVPDLAIVDALKGICAHKHVVAA